MLTCVHNTWSAQRIRIFFRVRATSKQGSGVIRQSLGILRLRRYTMQASRVPGTSTKMVDMSLLLRLVVRREDPQPQNWMWISKARPRSRCSLDRRLHMSHDLARWPLARED